MTTAPVASPPTGRSPSPWWRRHRPRLDDLVLVAAVLAGAGLELLADLIPGVTGATWWRVALTTAVAVSLWWRRRHPVVVALAACAAVALSASPLALPAVLVTLAVRCRGRVLLLVALAGEVGLMTNLWSGSAPVGVLATAVSATTSGALFVGLPLAVGAYAGAQRALVVSLRERAERAETEQQLRAERTRLAERARIAREMHDVLGHRISLVALHAGGLEVNPGAGAEDVERSAALIRTTARQALEDLRGVLGVLRADGAAPGAGLAPPPTLADVARLVTTSAEAGVAVRLDDDLPAGSAPPPLVARTAHRVVQEGLTNVHKHAPGAAARVHLAGGAGDVLEVEVSNARPVGGAPAPPLPGAGLGLVGLRERVELAGGSLHAGPRPGGGFAVRARLPWPVGPAGRDGAREQVLA